MDGLQPEKNKVSEFVSHSMVTLKLIPDPDFAAEVAIADPELLVFSEIMDVEMGDTPWEPISCRHG
jgi:hypothetical protein